MTQSMKAVVLAVSLAAASLAHADTFTNVEGTGKLSFSTQLLTALNAGGIDVQAVLPATVDITRNQKSAYTAVSATAPVTSLTATLNSGTGNYDVLTVATQGGAKMVATADDLTNNGGDLSITNLNVDVVNKTIYADLIGANGVGTQAHQALWKFDAISGNTFFPATGGASDNTITGLHITSDAKNMMVQSLGLTDLGVAALNKINDYGSISSHIAVVPEPSTFALLGAGLVIVGTLQRRRARR